MVKPFGMDEQNGTQFYNTIVTNPVFTEHSGSWRHAYKDMGLLFQAGGYSLKSEVHTA